MDIMGQSAYLVVNPITVDSYGFFLSFYLSLLVPLILEHYTREC